MHSQPSLSVLLKTNDIRWNAKEFSEETDGCWPLKAAPSYLRSLLSHSSIRSIKLHCWSLKTEVVFVRGEVQNTWLRTRDWSGNLRLSHLPGCELHRLQETESGVNSQGGANWEIDYRSKTRNLWIQVFASFYGYLFRMGRSLPHREGDCQNNGKKSFWRTSYPDMVCLPCFGLTMNQHSSLR